MNERRRRPLTTRQGRACRTEPFRDGLAVSGIAWYAKEGIMHGMEADDPEHRPEKPVFWVASSRKGLRKFPKEVRLTFGQALSDAQTDGKHPSAKPLRRLGGAGVLEVVEDDRGNTYRVVYAVKFAGAVYVLHAFPKKSKAGTKTPAEEIEKVRVRLKEAAKHHAEWAEQQKRTAEESDGRTGPG